MASTTASISAPQRYVKELVFQQLRGVVHECWLQQNQHLQQNQAAYVRDI